MAKRITLTPEDRAVIDAYAKREISATELCVELQHRGLTVERITGNTITVTLGDAIRHITY